MAPRDALRAIWANPNQRFAVSSALYLALVGFGYPLLRRRFDAAFAALERGTAQIEVQLLGLFGADITLSQNMILFGRFGVRIIEECTGVYEALIFAVAVLAYPTRWRHKLVGLAAGFPAIYLFNLIRIAGLLVIGRHSPEFFDYLHLYFWQGTMIALVASCWLIWLRLVVRREETPDSLD